MSTPSSERLYDTDFYAWTQRQAAELRRLANTRPNLPLDLAHIAEEIRDLGKSERDAVFSLARQIMQHLLLLQHSAAGENRPHWMDEIDEFRAQMKRKLSPTIRRQLKRELGDLYAEGRQLVERKMLRYREEGAAAGLPSNCPYSLDQILGDWLPDEASSAARQDVRGG
jgi:hypothetical protein